MSAFQKLAAAALAAAMAGALLGGCADSAASSATRSSVSSGTVSSGTASPGAGSASAAQTPAQSSSSASSSAESSVVYQNDQYGFSFTLPQDWSGYTIVTGKWEGSAVENGADKTVETGPEISIRDPRWTEAKKRQDIPVMVFTLDQWNGLQQDKFHIGAAPIGPSELGRNNKYVFALPARYNFAFDEGYEEVESILAGKPLQTVQLA